MPQMADLLLAIHCFVQFEDSFEDFTSFCGNYESYFTPKFIAILSKKSKQNKNSLYDVKVTPGLFPSNKFKGESSVCTACYV